MAIRPNRGKPTSGTSGTACYVTGTRLGAPTGTVAVEDLSVGTMVLTAGGEAQAVRWIGHRSVNCSRAKDPRGVWPIRIEAGAFAEGQPSRDLWVSPGHSVLLEGNLIPADRLINGATIEQVPRERVQYWHVELDQHGLLLAEGLAAESYLDTGNRAAFANGGVFIDAHPQFKSRHWAETCAPLVLDGKALEQARAFLLSRAQQLGYQLTADPDVHLVADGQRIEPVSLPHDRLAFLLPPGVLTLELRSRSCAPAHIDPTSDDTRSLGLCVSRIDLDGAQVALHEDTALADGWHAFEPNGGAGWRWTQDKVQLPPATRLVVIERVPIAHRYWIRTVDARQPAEAPTARSA